MTNTSKKKILWAIPRPFLPVSDGASKANESLLLSFFDNQVLVEGFEVTLLLFAEDEVDTSLYRKFPVENIVTAKKKTLGSGVKRIIQVLKNFFSDAPVTANFFDLNENRFILENLSHMNFYYILCDGLHPYCGLRKFFKDSHFIYRSHNVEFDLWNVNDASPIARFILSQQQHKMKSLELELIERAQAIWCISEEDQKQYMSIVDNKPIYYLPMALPFEDRRKVSTSEDFHFIFVGKLDWHPNTEGLKWFLDEVAPYLNENIKVSIVGKGDFPIERYTSLSQVEFIGFVERLEELYQSCDACLIPIFSGSGTRIKVIEALSYGTPILSTSFGVQGSAMEEGDCFLLDSKEAWVKELNHWDRKRAQEMASNAQNKLDSLYGYERILSEVSKLK